MDQKAKHAKATEFRTRIEFPAQRKCAITELAEKAEYSESDLVRLNVLFQKTSYVAGCEKEYLVLIAKLREHKDLALDKKKIDSFEAKIKKP